MKTLIRDVVIPLPEIRLRRKLFLLYGEMKPPLLVTLRIARKVSVSLYNTLRPSRYESEWRNKYELYRRE